VNQVEAAANGAAIVRARGLTKVYRTGEVEVHALRGVDLDLFEGELVVMLGPSGSGKSTLLNILGGLDTPSDGRVFFRDEELTAVSESALTEFRRRRRPSRTSRSSPRSRTRRWSPRRPSSWWG
jgi:predicted ABC-type transport system involved in lysophospholipase L1 biosynthesis ATPase subunit